MVASTRASEALWPPADDPLTAQRARSSTVVNRSGVAAGLDPEPDPGRPLILEPDWSGVTTLGWPGDTFTRVNRGGGRSGSPLWRLQQAGMEMDRDRSHATAAARRRIGRIVVRGEFGPLLGAALPECEIAVLSGETHLTAQVRDEAELFGLLERLRDLGAALVSVSIDP